MASQPVILDSDLVLDDLPMDVVASIEVRDRFMNQLGTGGQLGCEFIIEDLVRWAPGQLLRVAFLGGTAELHRDIADALTEITEACSIRFDFGLSGGAYRSWTEQDTEFAAEIRVSFDKPGYYSLVGNDSVNRMIGSPEGRVGGRPNQASLNLGGFHVQRPSTWKGTVRHEFMHALGFHHSHQNMRGPCEVAFRWEDDEGYAPTQDDRGTFVNDSQGRRPGIYTYLAGHPNRWDRAKVNHNLKTEENPRLVAGPFDASSVMLYRFPDHFYRTIPSPCAPKGDGQSLSDGDRRGLGLLYPMLGGSQPVVERQRELSSALAPAAPAPMDAMMGLEFSSQDNGPTPSEWLSEIASIMRRNADSAQVEE